MAKSVKGHQLKVMLVGGGSGGHVSPLRAIAETLSSNIDEKKLHITFVCEKGGLFDELMDVPYVHAKKKITAGKFRRYHGDSFIAHVLDVRTILLNIKDFFKFTIGFFQSVFYLLFHRPRVIFLKGGFVCVPIGWAAALLRIPYVTHDSDAVPGLANRLTAKRATKNLVALQGKYPYAPSKLEVVGVPINDQFFATSTDSAKAAARQKLSLPEDSIIVLITGGGLGAQKMNASVIEALQKIALSDDGQEQSQDMYIVHITGKSLYEEALDAYDATQLDVKKVNVVDFTTDMVTYLSSADIVVSRAGATAIAECAAAQKACIFIPGAHLTGGQQLHNASILDKSNAAIVVLEQDVDGIVEAITSLARDEEKRASLGSAIGQFAVKDSSQRIGDILITVSGLNRDDLRSEGSESLDNKSDEATAS